MLGLLPSFLCCILIKSWVLLCSGWPTGFSGINDARLAVRLVSGDGDVIWATTKESKGAKYKGASADVADQIVKQLLRDLEKLQSQPTEKKSAS